MAKQSNLEKIGIDEREQEFIKSPYSYNEETPYSATHPDALADGDSKGKGTGTPMTHLSLQDLKKGRYDEFRGWGETLNTDITNGAGGEYDIEGTKGVNGAFQGDSGRNYLAFGAVNAYNAGNEYGKESVDTSKDVPGQYWVE